MKAYEEELTQLKAELYEIMEKALNSGDFQTIKTTGSEKIPYVREDATRVIHLISRKAQIESALRGDFVPLSTSTEAEKKEETNAPEQVSNSETPSVPLEQPQDKEVPIAPIPAVEVASPTEPAPSQEEPMIAPAPSPFAETVPTPAPASPTEAEINQPDQPQPMPENNQVTPIETGDMKVSNFNNLDYQKMAFGLALLRRMQPILPSITDERTRFLLEQEITKQSEIVRQARSVLPVDIQREVEELAKKDADISEISPDFNEYITKNAAAYENAYKLYEGFDSHAAEIRHLQEEKEKIYKTTSESDQQSASFKREIAQIDSFIEKEKAKQSNAKEISQLLALSSTADLFFSRSEEKPRIDLPSPSPQIEPEMPKVEPILPAPPFPTFEEPRQTMNDTSAPVVTPIEPDDIPFEEQAYEEDYYSDEELDRLIEDLNKPSPKRPPSLYDTSDEMLDSTPIETVGTTDTYRVSSYHDAAQELLAKIPALRIAKQFIMRVQDYVDKLLNKTAYSEENYDQVELEEYPEIEGVSYYELFDTIQDWMTEFSMDSEVTPEQINRYISGQVTFSKPGQSLDDFEREDIPSSDDYCLIIIDPRDEENVEPIEVRPEIEDTSVHKASDGPVYAHIPTNILQLVEQKRETEDYTQSHSAK